MKQILLLIISFFLISCDGFDINADDNSRSDGDQAFTRSELAFDVLFSSLILNDSGLNNTRDGFIVLFENTAELTEIELRSNDNDSALIGSYAWTIENDRLQVSYPGGVTCTTRKRSETSTQFETSSTCSGGEPRNAQIRNTLIRPLAFEADDISGKTVRVENDNDDFQIEFFSNNSFRKTNLNSDGDEIAISAETGTFEDSTVFNNVVRLESPEADEHRQMFLLEGSLNSGLLLDLRYTTSTDTLKSVFIYNISENDRWDTESKYDDIRVE